MARAADWLSRCDWFNVLRLFSGYDRCVLRCAGSSRAAPVVSVDRFLSGRIRLVHHVSATTIPHVAANHRRRLLLQHRARCIRGGRGFLWTVLKGWRSQARVVLRRIFIFASRVRFIPHAEGEGLNRLNALMESFGLSSRSSTFDFPKLCNSCTRSVFGSATHARKVS